MRLMSQNNNTTNEEEEECYKLFYSGGLLNAPRKTPLVNPSAEFFLNQAISQKELQVSEHLNMEFNHRFRVDLFLNQTFLFPDF